MFCRFFLRMAYDVDPIVIEYFSYISNGGTSTFTLIQTRTRRTLACGGEDETIANSDQVVGVVNGIDSQNALNHSDAGCRGCRFHYTAESQVQRKKRICVLFTNPFRKYSCLF